MPGKKLLSLAAATLLGLSLAVPSQAKADSLNGWEGFGVGLLAAPLVYGITRPLFGGFYGAPAYSNGYGYGYGVPVLSYGVGYGRGAEYCARRYRSYDPATGTFLGYDGMRHICR